MIIYLLTKKLHIASCGRDFVSRALFRKRDSLRIETYGAYNMTKLFEFELCKFELLTSFI